MSTNKKIINRVDVEKKDGKVDTFYSVRKMDYAYMKSYIRISLQNIGERMAIHNVYPREAVNKIAVIVDFTDDQNPASTNEDSSFEEDENDQFCTPTDPQEFNASRQYGSDLDGNID